MDVDATKGIDQVRTLQATCRKDSYSQIAVSVEQYVWNWNRWALHAWSRSPLVSLNKSKQSRIESIIDEWMDPFSENMIEKTWKQPECSRILWSESDTSTGNRRSLDAPDASARLGQGPAYLGPYSNYVSLCQLWNVSKKRFEISGLHGKIQILIDVYDLISDSRGRSVCSYIPFRPAKAGGATGMCKEKGEKKNDSESFANWLIVK